MCSQFEWEGDTQAIMHVRERSPVRTEGYSIHMSGNVFYEEGGRGDKHEKENVSYVGENDKKK